MPNGPSGGSVIGRASSGRAYANACMKPSRASITPGGPSTPCSASSAACTPSRAAWPACRRLMSAPPLTKANRPARREPAQLAGRHRGAEHRHCAGRMEAAMAQRRMAGATNRRDGLVAGDDRLDHVLAARALGVADRQRRGDDRAAGMHRAFGVAVIELDAMRGGAAEESRVDEIGPTRAA